jgi:hypothetical protein
MELPPVPSLRCDSLQAFVHIYKVPLPGSEFVFLFLGSWGGVTSQTPSGIRTLWRRGTPRP